MFIQQEIIKNYGGNVKIGHSWLASINTRGEHKLGCPYCAGQRVVTGENDFESWCRDNNSILLDEWDL